MGGNSSPSRHTGIFITVTSELEPINGTGATNIGTTTGGKIVIRMKSPVFITKSADTATPRKTTTHTYIKIAAHPV